MTTDTNIVEAELTLNCLIPLTGWWVRIDNRDTGAEIQVNGRTWAEVPVVGLVVSSEDGEGLMKDIIRPVAVVDGRLQVVFGEYEMSPVE